MCGRSEHFRKKSIIPKEFVRHMPSIYSKFFFLNILLITYLSIILAEYKSHIPHDTLLLCYWCHIKSNAFDFDIRKKLFDMCQINELNFNEYQKVRLKNNV